MYFLKFITLSLAFLAFSSAKVFTQSIPSPSSWEQVKATGEGNMIIYWYTSRPFIMPNNEGQLVGIEYEIIQDFANYLENKHNVKINVFWVKEENFKKTFDKIHLDGQSGTFAASAFSKTPYRQTKVNFTPTYLSDISVMISSKNIPIASTHEEFDQMFDKLTAITITGTTYEDDLINLKNTRKLNFDINRIPSEENILYTIQANESTFGYIDLPIYLMYFNNGSTVNLNRQNLFSIKREGYSMIYPKGSDWDEQIKAYFNDPQAQDNIQKIVSKYIDFEIYDFIESYYDDNISLLTKEKEIQNRELLSKTQQIQQETNLRYMLFVLVMLSGAFGLVTYKMYKKRHKTAIKLESQQAMIASQRESIELQKKQLEERDKLMTQYNDEKNNLIKILAHDLRSPINHIQGLAQILEMENKDLSAENRDLIYKITDASKRVLAMISKILDVDAIEANRVNLLEEKVDINEFLQKVVESFSKPAQNKEINIDLNLPAKSLKAVADPLYLTEVMENLISNAIKFSTQKKKIYVTASSEQGNVLISVKDEGPGLSDLDQELLFKKFQTLSPKPTAGEQSTGLGLSIVKKYVELMKGEVWCESKEGMGCTFYLKLKAS